MGATAHSQTHKARRISSHRLRTHKPARQYQMRMRGPRLMMTRPRQKRLRANNLNKKATPHPLTIQRSPNNLKKTPTRLTTPRRLTRTAARPPHKTPTRPPIKQPPHRLSKAPTRLTIPSRLTTPRLRPLIRQPAHSLSKTPTRLTPTRRSRLHRLTTPRRLHRQSLFPSPHIMSRALWCSKERFPPPRRKPSGTSIASIPNLPLPAACS